MNYWLHPDALEDLWDAASYYRERGGNNVSQLLLAEFERAVGLLMRHPHVGHPWRHRKRRLVLQRFPYAIIYTAEDDYIRVFAVAHDSRRPGYWRKRK